MAERDGRDAPRVLVTGAGGPAAVAFMRAVTAPEATALVGDRPDVWAVDIDPCAAGLYLVPADRRALVPRGDDPGFADALLAQCRAQHIDVLVPTVDTELLPLCRRRDEFAAIGTTVLAPSVTTLERCLDKWDLVRACSGMGLVPAATLLDADFELTSWDWPAVVKPRLGSGGRGVAVVASPDELARLDIPRDGSHLVQELLPGIEHSLDVLAYRSGRVAAVVPRSRLKVDSGIAVAGRSEADDELVAIGRRVAEAIALTSVANVQVKEDADRLPRLLEVNPRFPGSMPLTIASGVDMPALALAEALGRPVPEHVLFHPVAMVRHWEDVAVPVDEFDALVDAGGPAGAPADGRDPVPEGAR